MAYASDESGRPEVYVIPFRGTGKWQVSAAGGEYPRWRADGRELFFLGLDGALTAASVSLDGDAFKAENPARLFEVRTLGFFPYAVTADGQRFLVITNTAAPSPPTLITNWPATLKAK